jgi:hypothetical protein
MNDSHAANIATELARIRRVLEQINTALANISQSNAAIANKPTR